MSDNFCGYDGKRDEVIVAYVYGELTGTERTLFTRHLTRCAVCQHEIEALGEVRAELASWTPPESGTGVSRQMAGGPAWRASGPVAESTPPDAAAASGSRRGFRDIPTWAQFAAAMLFLGVAAGIANVRVSYNNDGVSLRTGWSDPATLPSNPASPEAPIATQSDLAALAQQLRAELLPATTAARAATAAPAPADISEDEMIRRVRALIRDSERRQQRELALRVAEVAQDAHVQRQADLVRIDRTLGAFQTTTGSAVRRQEQLLNNLAVRVSQRQ